MLVIKRDGSEVEFDPQRIINAVFKAIQDSGSKNIPCAVKTADRVIKALRGHEKVKIHEIETLVEDFLMSECKDTARSYIQYRHDRDQARESQTDLMKDVLGLMEKTDESILNENANKDSKIIPTQRDLLAGIIAKHYAKRYILHPDITEAHELGILHYHDLDYAPFFPMFNCMLIDLKGMLDKGFRLGNAEIETPKSITTATAITAQIIAQVASHIYGGNTINHIDKILAPYVTKSFEKHVEVAVEWGVEDIKGFAMARTEKECYDAFQALEYEINTLHCANGQTPFTTFGFGLGTSWEERMIQKSIFKVRIKGLGKNGHTAVFPKLVFAIKDGVNHKQGDPNYDIKQLAVECATRRMYPDILNYDKTVEVTGSFKFPMGCRSFLNVYLDETGNEVHDGRNNLGVVSLNLPRIALDAKGSVSDFEKLLEKRLELCKRALLSRIDRLKGVKAEVAPILYTEGACGVRLNPEDEVLDIFKNGRASISLGYIGIHETLNALFGTEVHAYDSKEKREYGLKIVSALRDAVEAWKKETGYGFSLYSTPSENLCDRFCRIDTKQFGKVEGVTDKGYYTNSFHLDVAKQVNPYEKILFEMRYPALASGGFICYGEYPSLIHNPKGLEDVWDYSYGKVPYYGTNTPVDQCHLCGFSGEFKATSKGYQCPKCGNHESKLMNVIRRVCGYLGEVNARPFNYGKQIEVMNRVKHM